MRVASVLVLLTGCGAGSIADVDELDDDPVSDTDTDTDTDEPGDTDPGDTDVSGGQGCGLQVTSGSPYFREGETPVQVACTSGLSPAEAGVEVFVFRMGPSSGAAQGSSSGRRTDAMAAG